MVHPRELHDWWEQEYKVFQKFEERKAILDDNKRFL
jgi:hypothetical protein